MADRNYKSSGYVPWNRFGGHHLFLMANFINIFQSGPYRNLWLPSDTHPRPLHHFGERLRCVIGIPEIVLSNGQGDHPT